MSRAPLFQVMLDLQDGGGEVTVPGLRAELEGAATGVAKFDLAFSLEEGPHGLDGVVEYATDVSHNGDNATCQVVRLGGWERRSEGGHGSLGTKEFRDARRAEALDPRRGKR